MRLHRTLAARLRARAHPEALAAYPLFVHRLSATKLGPRPPAPIDGRRAAARCATAHDRGALGGTRAPLCTRQPKKGTPAQAHSTRRLLCSATRGAEPACAGEQHGRSSVGQRLCLRGSERACVRVANRTTAKAHVAGDGRAQRAMAASSCCRLLLTAAARGLACQRRDRRPRPWGTRLDLRTAGVTENRAGRRGEARPLGACARRPGAGAARGKQRPCALSQSRACAPPSACACHSFNVTKSSFTSQL